MTRWERRDTAAMEEAALAAAGGESGCQESWQPGLEQPIASQLGKWTCSVYD